MNDELKKLVEKSEKIVHPQRLLDELERADLLLINKPSLEFLGIISYGLKKILISKEYWKKNWGEVSLACTDGDKLYYLIHDNFENGTIIFLTLHEILHIISQHVDRRGHRDPKVWNIACDHVVNRVCKEISARSPKLFQVGEEFVFMDDIHKKDPDITAEALYDILMKDKEDGGEGRYKISEEDLGNGFKKITLNDTKTGKKYTATVDTSELPGVNHSEFTSKCEDMVAQAQQLWGSNSIERGNMPGGLVDYLNNIFKVEIPWNILLEAAILYPLMNQSKTSWTMPNFYMRRAPTRLPGRTHGKDLMALLAVIDASGSVSTEDLCKFVGVLMGASPYYGALHVLIHDVYVTNEVVVQGKFSEDTVVELLKNAFIGRGGTSHKDVFDKIENIYESSRISSVVFLTDFESDVECIYNNYDWIKDTPTTWVLNHEYGKEVELNGCKTNTIRLKR